MPITTEFLEISDSMIASLANGANAAAGCAISLSGNTYAKVTGITTQGSFAWARNETAIHADAVFNPEEYWNGVGVTNDGLTIATVSGDASNYSGRVCVGNYSPATIGPHLDVWSYTPRETVGGFNTGNTIYSTIKVAKNNKTAVVPCYNHDNSTYYLYWTPNISLGASIQWYKCIIGVQCPIGVSIGLSDDGNYCLIPGGASPCQKVMYLGQSFGSDVRCCIDGNHTLATAYVTGASFDSVTLALNDRILLMGQADQTENGVYTVNNAGAPTRAETVTSLASHNFHVTAGTVYTGKNIANTNASITYGSTNIAFSLIGSVVGAYTSGWACALSSDGGIQLVVDVSDKTTIYKATDWSTFTLNYTHTGQVDCIHNINTTKFLATSLGGGLVKTNDTVAWNTIIPTLKHHFVASNYNGELIIVLESGNVTDYCKLYDLPATYGTGSHAIYIADAGTPRFMAPNGTITALTTV